MFHELSKHIYDFKVFKTVTFFDDSIYNHKIEIHETNQEQVDILEHILSFNNKTKARSDEEKIEKMMFLIVQKISVRVEN